MKQQFRRSESGKKQLPFTEHILYGRTEVLPMWYLLRVSQQHGEVYFVKTPPFKDEEIGPTQLGRMFEVYCSKGHMLVGLQGCISLSCLLPKDMNSMPLIQ